MGTRAAAVARSRVTSRSAVPARAWPVVPSMPTGTPSRLHRPLRRQGGHQVVSPPAHRIDRLRRGRERPSPRWTARCGAGGVEVRAGDEVDPVEAPAGRAPGSPPRARRPRRRRRARRAGQAPRGRGLSSETSGCGVQGAVPGRDSDVASMARTGCHAAAETSAPGEPSAGGSERGGTSSGSPPSGAARPARPGGVWTVGRQDDQSLAIDVERPDPVGPAGEDRRVASHRGLIHGTRDPSWSQPATSTSTGTCTSSTCPA